MSKIKQIENMIRRVEESDLPKTRKYYRRKQLNVLLKKEYESHLKT